MLTVYPGDPASVPFKKGTGASSDENVVGIEYIDGLYGYAKALSRNSAEAEDLVQETYLRAIQAVSRLRPDSNLKGWLFTILRNVWFNRQRTQRRQRAEIEFPDVDGFPDCGVGMFGNPHDVYVSKIEIEQVRAAIRKLPSQLQEVLLLREYEDLLYREIADILGCPIGTVMSRLGRARAKLRLLLQTALSTAPSS